ncbi:MAG: hypothetical protein K0S08_977 [Gammaproteobacteria bacterium]|jgi:hypothetical protein|nr:hypothetical protein [Gammaproteobacteria bacterium]
MAKYLVIPLVSPKDAIDIKEIEFTLENFQALMASDYQNCLVIDLALALSFTQLPPEASQEIIPLEKMRAQHQHASKSLLIQEMGAAGVGVFLAKGATLDPQDDRLIYSGLYTPYGNGFETRSDKGFSIQQEGKKILILGEGQLSGYVQHLPEAPTIPDDLLKLNAAAANLIKQSCIISIGPNLAPELKQALYLPIRCLVPSIKIQAVDSPLLVGFDYSPSYWFARERAPLFFDQDGQVLVQQPYLLALSSPRHGLVLAYATEQAVQQVCQQGYFPIENDHIYFKDINKYDPEKRFVAIESNC